MMISSGLVIPSAGGSGSKELLEGSETLRPELRAFLAALLQEGVGHYVPNVGEEFVVARLDDEVLPLVINHGGTSSCYLTSPLCDYAAYPYDIVLARNDVAGKRSILAVLRALRGFYRATRLNRVVYVNNWLLPNQPTVHLDAGQVRALTQRLTELYPGYAVLFKGIEPQTTPALSEAVAAAGYETIGHRLVYFWDPEDSEARRRSDLKRDLGLLKRTNYRAGWTRAGAVVDSRRLQQLYMALYTQKYSRFHPQYTEAFISLAQRSRLLDFFLVERDHQIDGFSTLFRDRGHLVSSITGYDLTVPRKEGVYRIAMAGLIQEAMNSGLPLNFGAGADAFKRNRGARPRLEYEALYVRHLSPVRRLPWRILAHLANRFFTEMAARHEL